MQLGCCKVVVCVLWFWKSSYVRYSGCSGVGVVRAVVQSDVSIAFDEICAVVVLNKKQCSSASFCRSNCRVSRKQFVLLSSRFVP